MDLPNLRQHVQTLATLAATEDVVISCYVNLEAGRAGYRDALDGRIRAVRTALPVRQRRAFEEALGRVEAFLASGLDPAAVGAAIFSRGGDFPVFLPVQFKVPVSNQMTVDSLPSVFGLVLLKDVFHRYVLMISTETDARIVEVSLGDVTSELWLRRPELRKRVGREWTREHYQNHRRGRAEKFIKEKIEILERLVTDGKYDHLVLAGSSPAVAKIRAKLPKRLLDKLIDIVPIPGATSTEEAVLATLASFAEHEQQESIEAASLLLDELRRGFLAVEGTAAVLKALGRGQVDLLIIAKTYVSPEGWICHRCQSAAVGTLPAACPDCGERSVCEVDLKEILVKRAEQSGCAIEIVRDSDVLLEIGAVGALLRYLTPEERHGRSELRCNGSGRRPSLSEEL